MLRIIQILGFTQKIQNHIIWDLQSMEQDNIIKSSLKIKFSELFACTGLEI